MCRRGWTSIVWKLGWQNSSSDRITIWSWSWSWNCRDQDLCFKNKTLISISRPRAWTSTILNSSALKTQDLGLEITALNMLSSIAVSLHRRRPCGRPCCRIYGSVLFILDIRVFCQIAQRNVVHIRYHPCLVHFVQNNIRGYVQSQEQWRGLWSSASRGIVRHWLYRVAQ